MVRDVFIRSFLKATILVCFAVLMIISAQEFRNWKTKREWNRNLQEKSERGLSTVTRGCFVQKDTIR
jgi:hypothetical protein